MPDARNLGDGTVPVDQPRGCWFAYYSDRSGCAIFATEIDALRYAVAHSMEARWVEFGSDPFGTDR